MDLGSVGEDDIGTNHPIKGQTFIVGYPAISSMKQMTRDADTRAAAVGDGALALIVELAGDVAQSCPSADGRNVRGRVDDNAVHVRQINDQMIVLTTVSQGGIAMTAASRAHLQASCDTNRNNMLNLLGRGDVYNKGRDSRNANVVGSRLGNPGGALVVDNREPEALEEVSGDILLGSVIVQCGGSGRKTLVDFAQLHLSVLVGRRLLKG